MGTVRIISGRYKGRRLKVLDGPGLRPTTDRVRETVFNWLQFKLQNVACLDLFAGSGALGFEAASRYAGSVVLVEHSIPVADALKQNIAAINAENISVLTADAVQFVSKANPYPPFDVVFLDPPYHHDFLPIVAKNLETNGFLHCDSLIYVEHAADEKPAIPDNWRQYRSARAGQCVYGLYVKL
jgi:16S rRNA (guanine966-N2)-methyltransferase